MASHWVCGGAASGSHFRHYSWDVPHDLAGMLALWPSADAFLEKLETNLRESFEVCAPT